MQKTLVIKLTVIAGLCLILAIGLNMFRSVIHERQNYADMVTKDIMQQHVNPQEVINPFIAVKQTITPECKLDKNSKPLNCAKSYVKVKAILAKKTLANHTLNVSNDTYKLGIYHATSFVGTLKFNQSFQLDKEPSLPILPLATTSNSSPQSSNASNSSPQSSNSQDSTPSTPNDTILKNRVILQQTITHWEDAKLIIPVSDLRGVAILPTVSIEGKSIQAVYPEDPMLSDLSYIEVALPQEVLLKGLSKGTSSKSVDNKPIDIATDLPLSGISSLNTVPTGQNFALTMTSNWHAPKFFGKALPPVKEFTDAGFTAGWENHYLTVDNNQKRIKCLSKPNIQCRISSEAALVDNNNAHTAHPKSADTAYSDNTIYLNGFGVNFAEPNDVYLQTERSMKYALLLILVSFGTFFLFEIIKSSRIHPIQYLLVGSALLVFYVLLLSLAEQTVFWKAYLISATACVGLIGWYTYYMLGIIKRAAIFTAILAGLYGSFYGILTTEDLNLLLGAVFCFALIAAVMIMTRKIDWYQVT